MRTNTYTPIIILAANLPTPAEDKQAISKLVGKAYDKPALVGSYKGVTEDSYIVDCHLISIDKACHWGLEHNQETILFLDNQRNAFLVDCKTAKPKPIGEFVGVSKQQAMAGDSWTYNPDTSQYYICSKCEE